MMAVFVVFLLRLIYLQIIDKSYATLAERNAIRKTTVYPDRGLIYDRKGKLLVVNKQIFEIKVVPRKINVAMDTLAFCELLNISKQEFIDKINKAKTYSPYLPSTFLSQVSIDEFARIQERLLKSFNIPDLATLISCHLNFTLKTLKLKRKHEENCLLC